MSRHRGVVNMLIYDTVKSFPKHLQWAQGQVCSISRALGRRTSRYLAETRMGLPRIAQACGPSTTLGGINVSLFTTPRGNFQERIHWEQNQLCCVPRATSCRLSRYLAETKHVVAAVHVDLYVAILKDGLKNGGGSSTGRKYPLFRAKTSARAHAGRKLRRTVYWFRRKAIAREKMG